VALHADDGTALSLPVTMTQQGITQTMTVSSINAALNRNATFLISIEDQVASTVVGWADVLSSGTVAGFAIFRSTPQSGSIDCNSFWQAEVMRGIAVRGHGTATNTVPVYDNPAQ
jgi:hypothetical protein